MPGDKGDLVSRDLGEVELVCLYCGGELMPLAGGEG
jgi:hypothetical protein